MPCTDISVRYSARLQMSNVNRQVLAEALKLMDNVRSVQVTQDVVIVTTKDGSKHNVTISPYDVYIQGRNARELQDSLKQYYMTTVQAKLLQAQGFQVNVEKSGERIRIQANRI